MRVAAQNIGIDNYFIDLVRFSALTPYRASVPENGILKSGKSLWYVVENENIPEKMYLYGCKELTRYKNAHYYKRWEFNSPRNQNNTQPFALHSAIACITDILNSYRAISLWSLLEYYISSIKIIYLETGIDFANLTLPSLKQLTKYASHGRGSSSRYLRLFCADGMMYEYCKRAKRWSLPITEAEYTRRIKAGDMTAYVGSRNVEFKIYLKHSRIRVELAIRGRAQVLKFLNTPFTAEPSRHITKLADFATIQFLGSSYLDRLAELFGYLPRGAAEAVNRALASFKTTPMPQAWTIGKKQEPILPLNLFVQKEEPAIDINADRQARAIDGVGIILKSTGINKVVHSVFPSYSVCLNSYSHQRARAPPKYFYPSLSALYDFYIETEQYSQYGALLLFYCVESQPPP